LRRFDLQQRPVVLISQQIQEPVGTLPHVADALVQIRQQRFSALLAILVEDNPL
jgi:hypothetical protein